MNQKSLPRAPLPLALPFVVAAGAAPPRPPLARSTPWPHKWKNVFSRNLPAFHSLICSICAQPRCSCGSPPAHAHHHVQVEFSCQAALGVEVALPPPAWPGWDGVTVTSVLGLPPPGPGAGPSGWSSQGTHHQGDTSPPSACLLFAVLHRPERSALGYFHSFLSHPVFLAAPGVKNAEPPAVLAEPWCPVLGTWQHWHRVGIG